MLSEEGTIRPPESTIVRFTAAVAYAKSIKKGKKKVVLTGGHRGQSAKMDRGYIIIEREWEPL